MLGMEMRGEGLKWKSRMWGFEEKRHREGVEISREQCEKWKFLDRSIDNQINQPIDNGTIKLSTNLSVDQQPINLLVRQPINPSIHQPLKQSIHPTIHPFTSSQPANQPINQAIKQSSNQAIKQPSNQATKQSMKQSINEIINQ